MDESRKRTDRKSRNEKGSSRVRDMSWAAKYLDDDWENKYSAEGACDTRVALPVGDRKNAAGEDSRAVEIAKPDLSETLTFRASSARQQSEEDDIRIADAVTDETIASVEEDLKEDTQEVDTVRIRDALTDQTMANVEDAKAVRTQLFQAGFDEDLDELTGLRDARSNRFASAAAAASARAAKRSAAKVPEEKNEPELKTDLAEAVNQRAAEKEAAAKKPADPKPAKASAAKKTAAAKPAKESAAKKTAAKKTPDQKAAAAEKVSGAATIVASKEAKSVRKAAAEMPEPEEKLSEEEKEGTKKIPAIKSREPKREKKESAKKKKTEEPVRTRQKITYRDDYNDGYDDYEDGRSYRYDPEERYQYAYMPAKSPLRFIPLVLVIALCVFGFIAAREISHDVPLNASDYSKVKYTVTEGLTDEQLAQDLESLGIINNQLIFRIRCRFYSADYVEGTYELSPCYSTEKIINILSGYIYGTDD